MGQPTETRRWSVLHLLSHTQQLDVFRLYNDLRSANNPRSTLEFESLPPEVRLMIFDECIRQHLSHDDDSEPNPTHPDFLNIFRKLGISDETANTITAVLADGVMFSVIGGAFLLLRSILPRCVKRRLESWFDSLLSPTLPHAFGLLKAACFLLSWTCGFMLRLVGRKKNDSEDEDVA